MCVCVMKDHIGKMSIHYISILPNLLRQSPTYPITQLMALPSTNFKCLSQIPQSSIIFPTLPSPDISQLFTVLQKSG